MLFGISLKPWQRGTDEQLSHDGWNVTKTFQRKGATLCFSYSPLSLVCSSMGSVHGDERFQNSSGAGMPAIFISKNIRTRLGAVAREVLLGR